MSKNIGNDTKNKIEIVIMIDSGLFVARYNYPGNDQQYKYIYNL